MSNDAAVLVTKDAQRDGAKKATLEAMRAKRPKEDHFSLIIGDEPMEYYYVSIGSKAYDKLLQECPPTTEQMARGENYNQDKFAPELLSKVCRDPELNAKEWTEIWTSPDWNRGELMELFGRAMQICLKGLDPGPTVGG